MQLSVLNKRSDFLKVTKKGYKIVCRPFILFVLEDINKTTCSYGLIVSSKVGGAVIRNRIKRRLRHLVCSVFSETDMKGKIVCILAKKQSYYLKFSILEKELSNGLHKYFEKNI